MESNLLFWPFHFLDLFFNQLYTSNYTRMRKKFLKHIKMKLPLDEFKWTCTVFLVGHCRNSCFLWFALLLNGWVWRTFTTHQVCIFSLLFFVWCQVVVCNIIFLPSSTFGHQILVFINIGFEILSQQCDDLYLIWDLVILFSSTSSSL